MHAVVPVLHVKLKGLFSSRPCLKNAYRGKGLVKIFHFIFSYRKIYFEVVHFGFLANEFSYHTAHSMES